MVGRTIEGWRESQRKRENAISNVPEKRIVVSYSFICVVYICLVNYRGELSAILTFRRLVSTALTNIERLVDENDGFEMNGKE